MYKFILKKTKITLLIIGLFLMGISSFGFAILNSIENKILFLTASIIFRFLMGVATGFFYTPIYALIP